MDEAIPFFEQSGDDRGLFHAIWVVSAVHWVQGRSGQSEQLLPRQLELARRLGDPRRISAILHWRAGTLVWGPTPTQEGLRICDELLPQAEGSRFATASILAARSAIQAMLGLEEEARQSGARARAILEDLGPTVFGIMSVNSRVGLGLAELGDFEGAERMTREAVDFLQAHGEKAFLSTAAPATGMALARQGRFDEAEEMAQLGVP